MKHLEVSISQGRSYGITIERGLLARCGEAIRALGFPEGTRIAIVTDSNVQPLYGEAVRSSLEKAGFLVKEIVFKAGEASKNLETLSQLYDGLLDPTPFPLSRGGLLVALGGGVTGDLAGFAAATLFRGIPFVQIPTTLLAQVDSSVGGKVAVDLKQGKNLAGAFYQPRAVLIDPETLETLPDRVFFDGLSEVIKYGILGDEELFKLLESCRDRAALSRSMEEIVYTCCDQKRRIVERDELDNGDRMLLNFGHTLGHAYEKLGNYETYMHGEAVSCGMCAILSIGEAKGFTEAGTAERAEGLLSRFGLPTRPEQIPYEALKRTLCYDKKGSGDQLTVVLCRRIGESFLKTLPKEEILSWVLSAFPLNNVSVSLRSIPAIGENRTSLSNDVEPWSCSREDTL